MAVQHNDAAQLGRAQFAQLTTYRASGEPVATAVWIVTDGNELAVLTNADAGKVRRIRRNPAVTMVACSARGVPHHAASRVLGSAQVRDDAETVDRVWGLMRRKYAVAHFVLRIIGWVKPSSNRWNTSQVILKISVDAP